MKPIAFLIRHGETVVKDLHIFVSWTDVALDEEGWEQAADVKRILSKYDIQDIYSSPLQRCLDMAEMISSDVLQHRGLLPWNRGILTGISEEMGKDTLKLFMQNPTVTIPMGESRKQCEDRLESFFLPAFRTAEKRTAAFFTHHSVIDVLNCLVKGERGEEPVNLVKTGGIVAVYPDGDEYRLEPIHRPDDKLVATMS